MSVHCRTIHVKGLKANWAWFANYTLICLKIEYIFRFINENLCLWEEQPTQHNIHAWKGGETCPNICSSISYLLIQLILKLTYQQKITTKLWNIGHETLVHICNRHDFAFYLLATTKQLWVWWCYCIVQTQATNSREK